MVAHGRIEEALHEAAGTDKLVFAVTSVTDPRKGEVLVVVHTYREDEVPGLCQSLKAMALPNLFIPGPDKFLRVEQKPFPGMGKLDVEGLKELAAEHFA